MDKIKSILSSAAVRKQGPPVPPRPQKFAIQKALEKSRNQSPISPPASAPIAKGRTVIYSSNTPHTDHQHSPKVCENKCFDTNSSDSSTGLKVIANNTMFPTTAMQNFNNAARVVSNPLSNVKVNNPKSLMHHKSPVPRPRIKTPPLPNRKSPQVNLQSNQQDQHLKYQTELNTRQNSSSYEKLLMQNQNKSLNSSPHASINNNGDETKQNISSKTHNSNRDDELKEKLLNEIFSGRLVEASNTRLRYSNGSNLKRSSSVDVLNDRNSIIEMKHNNNNNNNNINNNNKEVMRDRKVVFHEMLILELSEMRRTGNDTNCHRLSLAKSCSDLSPNGQKQMTLLEMCDEVKSTTCLISLEDSGVEDEEKNDDCSSSGVGDSWDSCKDMHNR
jgi:hypothetical protein